MGFGARACFPGEDWIMLGKSGDFEGLMTADIAEDRVAATPRTRNGRDLVYRHTLFVRLAHWINAGCFAVLLMSGLQIFNAHPMLHWGVKGDEADPAILSVYAEDQLEGPPLGWVQIGTAKFDTT